MSYEKCLEEIIKAAGRPLSDDELSDLLGELQRRIRQAQQAKGGDDIDDIVRAAADAYADELAIRAKIEKRNAAINLKRRLEAIDFVNTRFANSPALGMEAYLVGINSKVKGTRNSAGAQQSSLKAKYLGGFQADIEKRGLWKAFVSGELDLDVARALWARNRDEPIPVDVTQEAGEIAEVVAKWQEVVRQDANRAGAWVNKMAGYIVRQSHNMYSIRAAGYEAWKADILPRLDAERTFDGADPDKFLRGVYEGLASGVHLKTGDQKPSGFKGPRNLAKKVSAERVLHFRDADAWFEYNQKYGTGNLREAVMRGFEVNAQSTGLMSRLGTNPEDNFNRIATELRDGIKDPEKKNKFVQATNGKLKNQLRALDGSMNMAVNHMGARIGSFSRIAQRLATLGGSLLSQAGDIPLYASEMRYQGRTMLGGIAESIGNLFRGRGPAERRELAGMIGAYSDLSMGEVAGRFSIADDDAPGTMSKLQQKFFKWNGMTWWTDRQRNGAIFAMAHRLALNVDNAWNKLDADLQRTLRLFDIDQAEWNIIRTASTKETDGRAYVTPEGISALSDEPFAALLEKRGLKPTTRRIADLKQELADKIRNYYIDRASYATISPDTRTRAILQRGTQPGTVEGEFIRFIGELKAFPTAVIQKAIGRELYGRGANTLGEALKNGNGEMLGMAQLILWTTMFGYLSMSAKDLAKGRTPRDITDSPYKTILAAMVQGGGAGIYGDFLFGEVRNRFGGGLLSTMAGPTLGTVEDLADLWGRLRNGDDTAAAAFKLAMSKTPFLNIFYTKLALDYLILWQVQEWLNPGALRRMEQRIEKENAQTFLIRPSQAVR